MQEPKTALVLQELGNDQLSALVFNNLLGRRVGLIDNENPLELACTDGVALGLLECLDLLWSLQVVAEDLREQGEDCLDRVFIE